MTLNNKKAQVTIFIIVGVVIVAAVALFFVFRGDQTPFVSDAPETNTRGFIEGCVEETMRNNIDILLRQGGVIEPKNSHIFNDGVNNFEVAYLCYNRLNLKQCIHQYPMFINHISNELENAINPVVEECFDKLQTGLEKQGFEIDMAESFDAEVVLSFGSVYLDIQRDLTISKSEETTTFNEMRLSYPSSLYELANVANNIANDEAQYCDFQDTLFMVLNPAYKLSIRRMSDSSKIYTIKDKRGHEEMNTAIRGCVL